MAYFSLICLLNSSRTQFWYFTWWKSLAVGWNCNSQNCTDLICLCSRILNATATCFYWSAIWWHFP